MSLDANKVEDLKSIEKCRNIHKEIINFGVNDSEILKLIEFLAMELENTSIMRLVCQAIKSESNDDVNGLQKEEKIII